MNDTRFILASQSPRRRQLLALLGYPFEIIVPGVDEDLHLDAGPASYVLRTAQQKAEAVAQPLPAPRDATRLIVIAADTTVALDETILGKPATYEEARSMLVALRGRAHDVHTAVCVHHSDGREASSVHTAIVTMRNYSDGEIDDYIATGNPFDKAGGYAIQHPRFRPVERLDGCFLGVVGLSLCDLIPLLRHLDVPDRFDPAALVDAHRGHMHLETEANPDF